MPVLAPRRRRCGGHRRADAGRAERRRAAAGAGWSGAPVGARDGARGPRDTADLPGADPRPAETWLRIVQVHDRITHRVDSALHRQHGLSLTGFEALRRIAEAPGERATMGEVAEAVGLSRPGRDQHGRAGWSPRGWSIRERAGGDKRLLHARLTPAGRQRVDAAAARTHDELVAHLLTLLGDDAGHRHRRAGPGLAPPPAHRR